MTAVAAPAPAPAPAPSAAPTRAWLALLALTGISYIGPRALAGAPLVLAGLTLAVAKGQLVVDHYMGLRRVHWGWRAAMFCYLAGVGSLVALAFLLP
ncbi:MAG: cytochrome C oxidase subunit IV family protein [Burkholderiales bacterium]|nr:cytochrome C oxidase subunit IV family protein [Burkholderiales bacterium]